MGVNPIIVFVVTAAHAYTHAQVVREAAGFDARIVSYNRLLSSTRLPAATYVFTDIDRLSLSDVHRAGRYFRKLREGGMRVLNDPARVRTRAGLLRMLYDAGINRFNAYRVEENVGPRRWPVFLRTEGDHGFPVTGLLGSAEEVHSAVSRALHKGVPLSALIIVEYAAEPVRPGLFRKLSLFRIGGRSVAHTCVHDDQWVVKYGKKGIAPEELYGDELRIVRDNPFWPDLQRAFELAAIDYGRVDFGLVDGKAQIYEINTNPRMKFPTKHPSPLRVESYQVFKDNYFGALRALDADLPIDSASIELQS